jgi:hypothetical protein
MMRRGVVAVFVLLALSVLRTNAFPQSSAAPIANCENITQPGDYVLTNNLVLTASHQGIGEGGDCLVISSSHVNIDLDGRTITIACPPLPFCPAAFFGPVGGTGIKVMKGADHVSISNGTVGVSLGNYFHGIVGEADHISATNLTVMAVVGISLDDVNSGTFTDVSYLGADERYHGSNGPILAISGGGHNTFTRLGGGEVGGDLSSGLGISVMNSNHNVIDQAAVMGCCDSGSAAILLTQDSSHNSITNSAVFELGDNGIEVDLGSEHNLIQGNTVSIISPLTQFAMLDQNPSCGSDVWIDNIFSNSESRQISASPANCIH